MNIIHVIFCLSHVILNNNNNNNKSIQYTQKKRIQNLFTYNFKNIHKKIKY